MGEKQYEPPRMDIIEIETSYILATSISIDNSSQGDFKEDFANARRGTWGNLWN